MPRVNIYLSDELMAAVRPLDLNISQVVQVALRQRIDRRSVDEWLDHLSLPEPPGIGHREAGRALDSPLARE